MEEVYDTIAEIYMYYLEVDVSKLNQNLELTITPRTPVECVPPEGSMYPTLREIIVAGFVLLVPFDVKSR